MSAALQHFPDEDIEVVRSHLWQLVSAGVLIPRTLSDAINQSFDLTKYGIKVLSEEVETPYDPIGFMQRIRSDAPNLENATLEYLQEALDDWVHRHLRSAAVMIGVASENETVLHGGASSSRLRGRTSIPCARISRRGTAGPRIV